MAFRHAGRCISLALLATLALSASACSSASSNSSGSSNSGTATSASGSKGSVSFVGTFTEGPYDYTDNGKMTGSDYALCNAAAQQAGLKTNWSNADFSTVVTGVQTGRYDAACTGVNITASRLEAVNFVSYRKTTWSFLQPGNAKTNITSLSQLCGVQVAELLGSVFAQAVTQQSSTCTAKGRPAVNLRTFNSVADAVAQLANGRADVVILDGGVATYYRSVSGASLRLTATNLDPSLVGVAVAKGNTALAQKLAKGLRAIMQNGTYARILKQYGLTNQAIDNFTVQQ